MTGQSMSPDLENLQRVASKIEELRARLENSEGADSEAKAVLAEIRSCRRFISSGKNEVGHDFFYALSRLRLKGLDMESRALMFTLAVVAPLHASAGPKMKEKDRGDASFGRTLAKMVEASNFISNPEPIERRVLAALASRKEGLGTHLFNLLSLIRQHGNGIDCTWSRLYQDVYFWDRQTRPPSYDWAKDFFSVMQGISANKKS
jgi:CRISPR type I-E-associated protein CasB/Cse2